MPSYQSVEKIGKSEYTDRKSVFIGRCAPVSREEEALAFLERCRKEFPDAKHHVFAYVLRENATARFSDDREPQGTAGLPVLDAIRKRELTDLCVVVVRYFGGVLLGTGGLVHAYTQAATDAILDAGVIAYEPFTAVRVFLSYNDYGKFGAIAAAQAFRIDETIFDTGVSVRGFLPSENLGAFLSTVSDATAGRARCEVGEQKMDFRK